MPRGSGGQQGACKAGAERGEGEEGRTGDNGHGRRVQIGWGSAGHLEGLGPKGDMIYFHKCSAENILYRSMGGNGDACWKHLQ